MKYRLLLFALIAGCAGQEIYMMSSEWSRWSPWSFCSGGVRVRVRACATVRGFKCIGHNKEFQSCDASTTVSSLDGKSLDGKNIDDPFSEDRSVAMKQLYPDYDQPFKPQAAKPSTTEAPFFRNNNLLERIRESDSLSALINRAAIGPPSLPSSPSSSSPPPPLITSEEYEDEEEEGTVDGGADEDTVEEQTTVAPPTTVTLRTTRIPEIRVASVTPPRAGGQVLARKRPIDTTVTPVTSTTVSTTTVKTEKMGLESLEHYDEGEEEEGSEYEEPSEGDEGGEKRKEEEEEVEEEEKKEVVKEVVREEEEERSKEKNRIVASASKIVPNKKRLRSEDEQKELTRRKENERKHVLHKVDGGDDDVVLSVPAKKTVDQSSQINHIPVVLNKAEPEGDNGIQDSLLGVEVEMKEIHKKTKVDMERIQKSVQGIIEKLEYEARFQASQGGGLSPLQYAYLKRSKDIRNQLRTLIDSTTTRATTTPATTTSTTSTAAPATPPEPLNPKIAEDTVRALDWLMENINGRLIPDGGIPPAPPVAGSTAEVTTTVRPRKVLRHKTRRPSYLKGVRYIENGQEIHPSPVRLHSISTQRSFRLPSSSIRTFGQGEGQAIGTQPVTTPLPTPSSSPLPAGIEAIMDTDWLPFEWSEWSEWSQCVCGWQLRKRICIPNSEEVQCPAPEYQRRKCEGGTCKQRMSRQ